MSEREDIFGATKCLTTDDLYRYAAGTLGGPERFAAEKHMVDCPLCSACAEDVREVSRHEAEELTRRISQTAAERTGFGKGDTLSAPAVRYLGGLAAAAVLITVAVIVFRNTGSREDQAPPPPPDGQAVQAGGGAIGPQPQGDDEWYMLSGYGTQHTQDTASASTEIADAAAAMEKEAAQEAENRKEAGKESDEAAGDREGEKKQEADDQAVQKTMRAVVDIFRRENISGDRKGRKGDDADSAGGKAYSALFESEETYPEDGMPRFSGGDDSLKAYLGKHIRVPARDAGDTSAGSAVVSFVVSQRGNISEISVMKGLGEAADREIIRSLRQMPSWEPADKRSREGSARYTLMIRLNPE